MEGTVTRKARVRSDLRIGAGGINFNQENKKFMKTSSSSSSKTTPSTQAEYLKILGSGEIVKWKSFSEIMQLYEVESVDGKSFTVQSNRVSKLVTPEEASDFLRRARA